MLSNLCRIGRFFKNEASMKIMIFEKHRYPIDF